LKLFQHRRKYAVTNLKAGPPIKKAADRIVSGFLVKRMEVIMDRSKWLRLGDGRAQVDRHPGGYDLRFNLPAVCPVRSLR